MDIACIYFTPFWVNLMDDLQKTSCHNLKNEWNWVPSNVPEPLAYAHINLSAFGSMNIHFPSEKLILPYFSSPRGVTTSVPFLEVRIKKGLRAVYSGGECQAFPRGGRWLPLRTAQCALPGSCPAFWLASLQWCATHPSTPPQGEERKYPGAGSPLLHLSPSYHGQIEGHVQVPELPEPLLVPGRGGWRPVPELWHYGIWNAGQVWIRWAGLARYA